MSDLSKYSLGIGDRFAHQGMYQLKAFQKAKQEKVLITPVWNKSHREHLTVGSEPKSVRIEAQNAVEEVNWNHEYLVDADHITFTTVDSFLDSSDFFTIDVAGQIGNPLSSNQIHQFFSEYDHLIGVLTIKGIDKSFNISKELLEEIGNKFFNAVLEAKRIHEKIRNGMNGRPYVIEISMDEVDEPQTPLELFFILQMLADQGIRVNTIAPKFTGRFNKGIDYEGDIELFRKEFEEDLLVIDSILSITNLPRNLKLSIHTGSDKFSLYPEIGRLIRKHDAGLHLKTAGTTWLEELIGLAESGGSGLQMVKEIYSESIDRFDELTAPYDNVLNIDFNLLPTMEVVSRWDEGIFSQSLRHDKNNSYFNPNFRQLLHTAYKIAAERGEEFLSELDKNSGVIGKNVYDNIYYRHILPLFMN